MSRKRIILDCDLGIDDAAALLILLYAQKLGEIKVEAIVCTMGNTALEHVCKNVVRLLEATGNTNIPVYKGAVEGLIKSDEPIAIHHGTDGFGDLEHDKEPDLSIIKKEPGSVAMREIVVNNPLQISLVCLGPLTTAALAAKLYQDFLPNLKDIYIMGGNYSAVGNITQTAEFNFFKDPEAVDIILNCAKCPITILPIETCYAAEIPKEWRLNVLTKVESLHAHLLNRAERAVQKYKKRRQNVWTPCDAFLAVALLYPNQTITAQSEHYVSIELHGQKTRGQVVLDHLKQNQTNATIIEKINKEFFMDIMIKSMA